MIDMHMHERTYSPDSFQALHDMVETARARGLDAICITDHDSMGLREYAEAYARESGFPIFVGVEFNSLQGDIIAFGIDAIPSERIPAQEFVDYVNLRGGVSFSCHPFRNNNRGLGHHLAHIRGLTGVEVLNGSTPYEANQLAYDYSVQRSLLPIGVSDAHHLEALGKYATWLPNQVEDLASFIAELKKGIAKPAIHNGSGYSVIEGASYFKTRIVAD